MFSNFSEKNKRKILLSDSQVSFSVFLLILEYLYSDKVVVPNHLLVDTLRG